MELSEEEKKIIDRINRSYDDNTQYVEASAKDWNCIVHLIRKQQKEIEELHKEINQRIKLKIENEKCVDRDFIYKGKIRELKEKVEKEMISNPYDFSYMINKLLEE